MSASDNEIELAVGGQPASAPTTADANVAQAAPVSSTTEANVTQPAPAPSTTTNVAPDVAAIQAMVDAGVVVGADPSPTIPASERRAQVEADLAARGLKPAAPEPDSESSSEFESSSEEESDDEPKAKKEKPLTNEEQAELRSKLDKFYGYDVISDSEEEEEDDEELAMLEQMGLGEEDNDGGPVMSAHEQPLPPVALPPISQLPQDMPTTLAGEVVSWMKDRQVENWLAKQSREGESEVKQEGEAKSEPEVKEEDGEAKPAPERSDEPMAESAAPPSAVEVKQEPPSDPADVEMADSAGAPAESKPAASQAAESKPDPTTPKFTTSGTLIIKATPLPGYLESGSILATSSGAVLGVVFDTFGPLTQPFYNLRLPPPPYALPEISPGDKVYVPSSPEYRFFVDMNAVRDPRFRSDASNVYDEEVGDEEREWSDDEKEAEYKRQKKQKRKAKRGGASGAELPSHLPQRPDFDAAGGRSVISYDDETPAGAPGGQRGRGARGRGGDRGDRGDRGGRGRGGRGRGQGRPIGGQGGYGGQQQQFPGFTNNPHGVPNMPYAPAGYNPMQPEMGLGGFNPMMMGMPMQMGYGAQFGQYAPQQYGQQSYGAQQQGQQGQANAPAINPRFAQQYGFWPQQGGQGQGEPPYSE